MGKTGSTVAVLLTILAVSVVFSLATTRRAESSDPGQVGRYQIVAGCYESTIGEGLPGKDDAVVLRGGVFRIDTTTGETWVLKERIDTSSIIQDRIDMEWLRID